MVRPVDKAVPRYWPSRWLNAARASRATTCSDHGQRHGAPAQELASGRLRRGRTGSRSGERHPHDLRHTAASLAVASGATVKSVQRMLGHASAAMTLDVYSGLFDDDLTALADRMDAAARAAAEARVGATHDRQTGAKGKCPGQDGGPRGDRTRNPRIKSSPETLF